MRAFAAGLAVLLLLGVVALLAAEGSANKRRPTAAVPALPTATPTAEPAPEETEPEPTPGPPPTFADLPVPKWTPVDAAEAVERARPGSQFLLDTQTGQLYSMIDVDSDWSGPLAYIQGWTAAGEALVRVASSFDSASASTFYVGRPLGPLRLLHADIYDFGSTPFTAEGLVALRLGDRNVLIDPASGAEVAELPGRPWSLVSWSVGDQLLLWRFQQPPKCNSLLGVWSRTGRAIIEFEGDHGVWSHDGQTLAYLWLPEKRNTSGHCPSLYEVRVREIDSGAERTVGRAQAIGAWSPGDRYLVTIGDDPEVRLYSFEVVDVRSGARVRVNGAFFGGWLDSETLLLTGNACGEMGYFTLRPDGTGLRLIRSGVRDPGVPKVSPEGDRLAFNDFESGDIVIYSIASGVERRFHIRPLWVPSSPLYLSDYAWSPDGRFLLVSVPPGKGGPCESDPPQTLAIETS